MASIGVIAITLEVNERIQLHDMQLDFTFFFEALLEGVALPVLGGLLLTLANRAIEDRSRAMIQLSHKEALSQAIGNAQNWNDLLKTIVEFPHGMIPLVGSVLLVYESTANQFEPEAFWGLYGVNPNAFTAYHSASICETCILNRSSEPLKHCECDDNLPLGAETKRHCLPLLHGGEVIALLQLFTPGSVTLSKDQQKMLSGLAPEMALAIDDARNRRLNSLLKEKSDEQLRNFARNLHNNLAQNLVFVRHKLDELTGADPLQEITNIRQDLQRMREVVDDAYIDVRNTLKEIEANVSTDLVTMLRDYAHLIEERNSLRFHFMIDGRPNSIPTRSARQVLAIFGEMITNIEKHAGAEVVEVHLAWEKESLIFTVLDDGRGFDYHDSSGHQKSGHLGLGIMADRAEEIGGKLTVNSALGKGTEIKLWLPLIPEINDGQFARRSK